MAAVLCTALPDIGAGTASPAIALISQAMPEVDVQLVQMIVSIPSVCLIFFPSIYAKLTEYVKKKTLLWAAFLMMLIGAVGPLFFDNIYQILVCRFILGLSNGIIMPITIDLIMDLFEGHEQQSMLGYAAAVTSIGGIVFQTLGGWMGSFNWHYCFLATCVSVPFYLFALFTLPDIPVPESPQTDQKKPRMRDALSRPLLILGAFMVMWELLYFVFLTNSSLYLVNSGIATTTQVGFITSMVTVGGLIMSALYGRMIPVFKQYILPLAYLITAIGFVIICFAGSVPAMMLGALAIGIGYGISAPCQLNLASSLIPHRYTSVATSVCYTARGIGGFISPVVIGAICSALGKTQGLFSFQLAAVLLFILVLLMLVYEKKMDIHIS